MADETPAAEKMLTLNLEWGNMDTMPIFFIKCDSIGFFNIK